jgi:hypothetical protein
MFKPTVLTLAAGMMGLFLAGCSAKRQPPGDSAPRTVSSSDNVKRVTVRVVGMTKVQRIT